MKIVEPSVMHHFDGVIEGKHVVKSVKLYQDANMFYNKMDDSISAKEVMYEVYSYSKGDAKEVGNLNWGLTILKPIYVDGECNMTRGHFHEDLHCAEFYFGIDGEGLLLLMDEDGVCKAEKVSKGSLHHIEGTVAHRLINTGESDLKVGACWPTTAGHDYARIERNPFPIRIYKKDNQIVCEEEINS